MTQEVQDIVSRFAGREGNPTRIAGMDDDYENALGNAHKWNSVSALELKQHADTTPDDLVPGLVPSRGVVTFAGKPGIGKSFTALSWAASVAAGTSWFGAEASEPKPVFYVLGEGWARFGRRVEAWEQANDTQAPELLRFIDSASAGIDLLDPHDVKAAVEVFTSMSPAPALIIFDTFAMVAGVSSENDNSEVVRAFNAAHRIVNATGATVMFIHHLSKQAGMVRGATAFRGQADTVIVAASDEADNHETFYLSTKAEHDGKQRDTEGVCIRGFAVERPGVLTCKSESAARSESHVDLRQAMANDVLQRASAREVMLAAREAHTNDHNINELERSA